MAAIQQLRMAPAFSTLLPRLFPGAFISPFRGTAIAYPRFHAKPLLPSIPSLAVAIPAAVAGIPAILRDIWEGVLRAVPKSKTSHMKKRHRQMAGKALKDVTSLNKCPVCGGTKKMHTLCPSCMGHLTGMLDRDFKQK
ncbi:hypothetical protein GGR56DRAFT_668964 [Xylariaceae sp. FL0804]|nr:hypothetical protein GGR56DRAFT_668964 [Xylariaceae sp. FL0804]